MAINQPHDYAWKLFLYLNRQAASGTAGVPGKATTKDYDEDKPVVWETWARASGSLFYDFLSGVKENRSEVFRPKGAKPVTWQDLDRSSGVEEKAFELNTTVFGVVSAQPRFAPQSLQGLQLKILLDDTATIDGEFEVRMNRSTYDTVREEGLYSIEGLEAKFQEAKSTGNPNVIQFELESKEVKAKWVKLDNAADKDRYHWRTITLQNADGTTREEVWGLSGFHIITKDLPNWFWTDFEHVDQEQQAIDEGRPSVDPTTRGAGAPHGANGVRNETRGTKWEFYRLRGVQLDFVDKFGKPTRLANTLIDPIESGPSSCITCHAFATAGMRPAGAVDDGSPRPFKGSNLPPRFVDGIPDPAAYFEIDGETMKFIQTDFLWSMPFRARSTTEPSAAK